MARPYRLQGEGVLYHITSRGDDRKKVFISKRDFSKFLEYLKLAQNKYKFYVYAYCLMSNHYHLFIETTQPNLSRLMQYLNTSYTVYYNKKRNRIGHVFQGRFKSIVVEADSYFKELTRYIHLNPVKAKLVEKPEEYYWSSYKDYFKRKSEIIDLHRLKMFLDMNMEQYKKFVISAVGKSIDPFRDVYAGCFLGRKEFIEKQLEKLSSSAKDNDFSFRKTILNRVEPDNIISYVAKYFKIDPQTLITSNRRPMILKKMAIYLIRAKTALTNRQIGELFNMKPSAVSRAAIDFKMKMVGDKVLTRAVNAITSKVEV